MNKSSNHPTIFTFFLHKFSLSVLWLFAKVSTLSQALEVTIPFTVPMMRPASFSMELESLVVGTVMEASFLPARTANTVSFLKNQITKTLLTRTLSVGTHKQLFTPTKTTQPNTGPLSETVKVRKNRKLSLNTQNKKKTTFFVWVIRYFTQLTLAHC